MYVISTSHWIDRRRFIAIAWMVMLYLASRTTQRKDFLRHAKLMMCVIESLRPGEEPAVPVVLSRAGAGRAGDGEGTPGHISREEWDKLSARVYMYLIFNTEGLARAIVAQHRKTGK